MKQLFSNFSNERKIKLLVLVIVLSIISLIPIIRNKTNDIVNVVIHGLVGQAEASSKIHLIKITEDDIKQLGWPIKRNYYALLLNKLKSLEPKKIGLEVFLSKNLTSQSVYNKLLRNEVEDSDNIVLSAFAENVRIENNKYIADSIYYSQPIKVNDNILSGHLNYYRIRNQIVIPKKINEMFSFSYRLAGENISNENLIINRNLSWNLFSSESLIHFLKNVAENKIEKKFYKGKIILIGVTDQSLSKSVDGYFDDYIPGIGLHSIAINNIINNELLNENFVLLSAIIFGFFSLLLIIKDYSLKIKSTIFILIIFLSIYISSLNIVLDYSVLIIPLIALSIVDLVIYSFRKEHELSAIINENTALQKSLTIKENKVIELKEIKSNSQSEASQLQLKIESLQEEIDNLQILEQGSKAFELKDDELEPQNFHGIIFISQKMKEITSIIKKVAPEEATVLILGESGSGKELVSNAIHNLSKRCNGNFIALNCAALPDNLLESELFGYKKGAFTNAHQDKIGLFEAANDGTIFLDEIGETSENFQVKLLRVLQSGEFTSLGDTAVKFTNARIIAATNRKLNDLVEQGEFRQDLFYRLNVISIELPTLDERKEDIPIIADFFVKKGSPDFQISKLVMDSLINHKWIGNIRELESVINRAIIFCKSDSRKIIQLSDLPESLSKIKHTNIEQLILQSLREKDFSHSSINETGKELGNLSRTIISENLRGMIFKSIIENDFDLNQAVLDISDCNKSEVIGRVNSKIDRYLKNIISDLNKNNLKEFELAKQKISSKYKNLPQRYHHYLDEIVKHFLPK